ncbi:uncharacterized protein LOC128995400 [Macrosteles quadrilineatus]|uniref:uncharacterized protein LOC128995400 n=1 Tax=Macrosteles quadrilineatus TaxID=74068 RepID=UPI0023E26D90|nr:uncharacterized protein LOC128995400 [Macrosteles quadrilineatus]
MEGYSIVRVALFVLMIHCSHGAGWGLTNLKNAATTFSKAALDKFPNVKDGALLAELDKNPALKKALVNALDNAGCTIGKCVSSLSSAVDIGSATASSLKDRGEKFASDIKEQGENIASDVKNTGEKLASDIKEQGEKLASGIKDTGEKVVGAVSETITVENLIKFLNSKEGQVLIQAGALAHPTTRGAFLFFKTPLGQAVLTATGAQKFLDGIISGKVNELKEVDKH